MAEKDLWGTSTLERWKTLVRRTERKRCLLIVRVQKNCRQEDKEIPSWTVHALIDVRIREGAFFPIALFYYRVRGQLVVFWHNPSAGVKKETLISHYTFLYVQKKVKFDKVSGWLVVRCHYHQGQKSSEGKWLN